MVHPRKFVRDSLGVAFSQYLARGMVLARGVAAAAALGPHGYGGWNALNLIFDYGSYASLGAHQGLDLRLPAAVAEGNRARAHGLMAAAWSVTLGGGAFFSLGLALLLGVGGAGFAALPGAGLAALMLVATLLQLVFQYLTTSLRAFARFRAVSAGTSIQAALGGGLGLALVWSHGAWGLLLGWIAGTLAALAWMRRAAGEVPLRPGGLGEGMALARLGLPIFATFVATLVLRSVDRIALVRFADAERLGLYSLGLMATGLVLHLPEAVAYVLFPRIAAAFHGSGDRARVRDDVLRTHRALALCMPLVVGIGMLWAAPVVRQLLPAYLAGVPALRQLSFGAMALSAATVPGYYLLAAGRQRRLLAVAILAAVLNTALVFVVAARDPRPEAVATAASVGYGVFAIAVLALAAREWFDSAAGRVKLVAVTLLPAVWAGGAAHAFAPHADARGWAGALVGSAALVLIDLPVLMMLGRGSGLVTLVREWLRGRTASG